MFCCFSWEILTKSSPNPGLVNEFSATPRGQIKLDRPHCKQFWYFEPFGLFPFCKVTFGDPPKIPFKTSAKLTSPDLFSRRFREGISFPKFVQRSILKLPLSKLCAVPLALQNRAAFETSRRRKMCPERGSKRGDQQRGQKGKKDAWKQVSLSGYFNLLPCKVKG